MTCVHSAVVAIGLSLAAQLTATTAAAADDMTARRQALEPYFRTYQPNGAGPFPALLFVSGCSGFAPSVAPRAYTSAAERWRAKGYLVVFVDYLAARHLRNCRSSAMLTLAEIGRDVLAVAAYLRTQPSISPARITAIGWSYGGGGVLAALEQMNPGENGPLHAIVAYYPVCRDVQPWRARVPVLSLMGAQDEVARPAECQQVFAQLPPGTPLETRVYPEARHGFDAAELPPYAKFGREIVGYNATAAGAASRDIEQFLGR